MVNPLVKVLRCFNLFFQFIHVIMYIENSYMRLLEISYDVYLLISLKIYC